MEKQIEEIREMARDLQNSEHWRYDDLCLEFKLDNERTAENLYNAGYRKASDVAREIFEEIDDAMTDHARGDIDNHWLYVRVSELKKKYESEGEE